MKNSEKIHLIKSSEEDNKPVYDENSSQSQYDSFPMESRNGEKQPNGYIQSNSSVLTESVDIPEEQRIEQQKGRIGTIASFIHIIRCHMGAGLLGSAKAVNYAGLGVGFVLFITSGLLVLSGMHLILSCASRLGKRLQTDHTTWTYQDIVEKTFLYGSPRVRKFAVIGRSAAIISSTLLQFGVCSFFFIIVGDGLHQIIPVQNKMKKPEKFSTPLGVLNLSLAFVIFFIIVIGCLGYWKYGENTETNILLNLPSDQWLCVAAKIMVIIAVLLTYPIQFYFIFVMIWQPVADRITSPWLLRNGEYIQRLITLVLTFACALFVPHLDLLMSLFGSVCSTVLGFIIPGFTDIVSHTSEGERLTALQLIRDVILILIGVFFFCSGTYFAMKHIIATF